MPEIVVAAQSRTETGKNANRRLRAQGLIPGVVYGQGGATRSVAVSPKLLGAVLKSSAGTTTLFDLEIEGTRSKVILKEHQIEPIKGSLLHADFYQVAMDQALEVTVHLELTGVPVGVKVEGGLLDFITRELQIECLPADIPEKIVVDVTPVALGKHLRVSDLKLPANIKVVTEPDVVIVHVVAPRAEVVATPEGEVAAVAGAEPEVIKKGKAPGEGEAKAEAKPEAKKAEKKEKK